MIGIVVVIGLMLLAFLWHKKAPSSPQPSKASDSHVSGTANQSAGKSAPTQDTPRFTEEPPAVGEKAVLSLPQLRYCAAENMRLDAAKEMINSHNQADVDRFNLLTADYNERCTYLRYRRGTLERARSEVEQYRAAIEAEGRDRFSKKASVARAPSVKAVPAESKPKVRSAEPKAQPQLLREAKVAKPALPSIDLAQGLRPRSSCTSSTECTGAALCLDGQCRSLRRSGEQCVHSHECAGSNKCMGGRCRLLGNVGDRCTRSQECSGTNQCLDGQCRPLRINGERCEASFECAGLNECVQGRCQLPQ